MGNSIKPCEFILNDGDVRLTLAKSVGLNAIPEHDPNSLEKLSGVISSNIKTEDFDSTELVKAVRGC